MVCVGVQSGASYFEGLFREWARITKMVMLQRSIGQARELRLDQRVPRLTRNRMNSRRIFEECRSGRVVGLVWDPTVGVVPWPGAVPTAPSHVKPTDLGGDGYGWHYMGRA